MEVEAVDEGKLQQDPGARRHRGGQGQRAHRRDPGRGRGSLGGRSAGAQAAAAPPPSRSGASRQTGACGRSRQAPAPAPQPRRRLPAGTRCRAGASDGRAHLRQPAGPAHGRGRRHRSRRSQRQRPAWPDRQGGHRGGPGPRSRGQAGGRPCRPAARRRPPRHRPPHRPCRPPQSPAPRPITSCPPRPCAR